LEASHIEITERVSASQKLGASDARELARQASDLIVAKGKKLSQFPAGASVSDEAIAAMLGPTGNLRAPTLKVGNTLLVGFNEDAYRGVFE
jgi:arsenate reductase-like glutaredoxin family protein